MEYILQCIYRSDFNSLQSVWSQLNRKFFSRLNHESQNSTFKLESSILKFYLTHANRQGRHEEVRAFFEKMSDSLASRRDWKEWFGKQRVCSIILASLCASVHTYVCL